MQNLKLLLLISAMSASLMSCGESGTGSAMATVDIIDNAGSIVSVDPSFDALVPAEANIQKLAGGFAFTEGPVWNSGLEHLMFSDLRSNAVHTWDDENGLRTLIQPVFEGESDTESVGSNGLNVDSEGRLLLMEHGNRQVSRVEPGGGERTVLVNSYRGKRLNSPNDSAWHSNGWLYFTDPPYGLAGLEDDPARELDYNGIYRLSPSGEIQLLYRDQTRPNGIAFSPDEKTLYVANSDAENKVWYAYNVVGNGIIGNPQVFYDVNDQNETGAADGMKVDVDGNVFATGPGGVWVFSPDGIHLGTIKPDEVPANVAWGDEGSTLYMTARTGLYRVKLNTRGIIP
ncbi:MAG: SMP-30/gluconolactonase/LRE family protein [Pseudohongiella sp.]|jgi:gluconolactonase